MAADSVSALFNEDVMARIFPMDRADHFFDALYGDPADGAFDIQLKFGGHYPEQDRLAFEFHLSERPGHCMACNLTYGLPEVFSRHPVVNVRGLVKEIDQILDGKAVCGDWRLGGTNPASNNLHIIPLDVTLGR